MLPLALLVLSWLQAAPVESGEVYAAVSVDRNGALAITRADGSVIGVHKRRDQTTFEKPRLSREGGRRRAGDVPELLHVVRHPACAGGLRERPRALVQGNRPADLLLDVR